jgi:hypothetical protein
MDNSDEDASRSVGVEAAAVPTLTEALGERPVRARPLSELSRAASLLAIAALLASSVVADPGGELRSFSCSRLATFTVMPNSA